MSLIRVRRSRKREWMDVRRGPPLFRLVLRLVFVVVLIWYLSRL